MKLDDIRALTVPHERVQRLFTRLIPLADGARFARMPLAAQRFFCAFEWLGEVNNGGVPQYFSNSAGDRWRIALDALDTLASYGDVDGAGAFRLALAQFPNGEPDESRWQRCQSLPALDDAALAAAVDAARDGTLLALSRFIGEANELRFIDRFPSGLKALDLPDALTMAEVVADDDPWLVVTGAFHVGARLGATPTPSRGAGGEAPPVPAARTSERSATAWATFDDAFAVLDEVSAGGFVDWSRTRVGARWRESAAALRAIGVPAHAALVERAVAVRDAGGPWQDAMPPLNSEHQANRTALAEALARFVKASLP